MFTTFRKEGKKVLFDTYVRSDHELETFAHIVLADGEVEWDPENLRINRNMPYRDKSFVAEMSRKRSKGGTTAFFHKSDLILGLVTNAPVADTSLERLVSAVNVKEEEPSRIRNGKSMTNMAHKKWTLNKVVVNLRHSAVTSEYLSRILNIGLD